MKIHNLKIEKRKVSGRKVKNLRAEGLVPANIFGKSVKSLSIQTKLADFEDTFKEAGETSIIELLLGSEKRAVLISNVQYDPITDKVIHIDFHQVNLKEKTTAQVPVMLVGESPAEKQNLGTAVQYINEIEVEALPMDLPEKFEVDISGLEEVDSAVLVKDLKYDKAKIEISVSGDDPVVKVEALRKEEEVKPVEEETVEGEEGEEAEGKEGETEGQEPGTEGKEDEKEASADSKEESK